MARIATTLEELTTAQSFQYKTATLSMYLNERDGFDPVNDDFHRELFQYSYQRAVRYNDIMTQHNGNPLGIEFKSKSSDQYSMLTPDMSEPGRFRASYFDKQGFSSHNVYDTIPQAVEEMVQDGYYTGAKGILSQLSAQPEFEIGNRVSTLIGELNRGKITHQEFFDQRQAIHDEVNERMDINSRLKSLIENGANINQLLATIVQHEQAPLLASLATLLQNKQITATIEFDKSTNPEDDYIGLYTDGNPPNISLKPECGELLSQVLLHECIHAVTYDAVRSGDKASNIYLKRLNEIKQHARKELIQKGIDPEKYYGLSRESHTEELITEIFTDPDLRQVLQQVSSKAARGTKFSDTITNMYDDIIQIVNNIIGGEEKHHPVIKELMEIGAGLMIVNNKYTGATMNTITNDRGETVPAVGNEISIARAKVKWPDLIESLEQHYKKGTNSPLTFYKEIAARRILNPIEAQSVLDAAKPHLPEQRITINPEIYSCIAHDHEIHKGYIRGFQSDDKRVAKGDDIAGDSWINLKSGEKQFTAVEHKPVEAVKEESIMVNNIGDKVIITPETYLNIIGHPKGYVDKVKEYLKNNTVGTVVGDAKSFMPGYAFNLTVKFGDDSLHMKDNYVTNLSQTHLNPKFPALSESEAQELSDFTNIIKHSFPESKTEELNKLCTIASDMQKFTIQNANGTLSTEKFNSLTDHQESQIQALIKNLPGVKVELPYNPKLAAIWLDIPVNPEFKDLVSTRPSYPVPEIPKNKLVIEAIPAKATITVPVSIKR